MTTSQKNLQSLSATVAKELVSVEMAGENAIISVPLLYPSGSSALVNISQHGERFFLSDLGYGFQEAEMYGATGAFHKFAEKLAEHYGVAFDNQSFFVAEASRDSLPSAVTIIANCSVEAANTAALKASERRYADDSDVLYSKLVTVYPKEKVARNVQVIGSSTHRWPVAALVSTNGHEAIFEPVSKHHNSVVNAAAKFHDIARLDDGPSRVAMVKNIVEMNDYINILSQAARVIEYSADNQAIQQAAA